MAEKPAKKPAAAHETDRFAAVDPDKQYRVALNRVVILDTAIKTVLRPQHDVVMKGKVLLENSDAIATFVEA